MSTDKRILAHLEALARMHIRETGVIDTSPDPDQCGCRLPPGHWGHGGFHFRRLPEVCRHPDCMELDSCRWGGSAEAYQRCEAYWRAVGCVVSPDRESAFGTRVVPQQAAAKSTGRRDLITGRKA